MDPAELVRILQGRKRELKEFPPDKKGKRRKPKVIADNPISVAPGTYCGKGEPRKVYDSKDEEIYHDVQLANVYRGVIKRCDFQPERFHIGEGAWFTPDFRILHVDDTVEFVEIKGYAREAALVRLKVAAMLNPYRFTMLRLRPKNEGGGFEVVWSSHKVAR